MNLTTKMLAHDQKEPFMNLDDGVYQYYWGDCIFPNRTAEQELDVKTVTEVVGGDKSKLC